jgi:hypothetical protein
VGNFLKKLKTEVSCAPAVSLLGIYSQEKDWGDIFTPIFIAAVFRVA